MPRTKALKKTKIRAAAILQVVLRKLSRSELGRRLEFNGMIAITNNARTKLLVKCVKTLKETGRTVVIEPEYQVYYDDGKNTIQFHLALPLLMDWVVNDYIKSRAIDENTIRIVEGVVEEFVEHHLQLRPFSANYLDLKE